MTDFQTITIHQPALAKVGEAAPYLRLASQDGHTFADVEFREAGEGVAAQIQVAVLERDAAGNASPVMAGVFDVESGSLAQFGKTVSTAFQVDVHADALSALVDSVKELVACPATAAE